MEGHTGCTGCGLLLPTCDGPVHAYVTTSPECWALFTEHLRNQTERMFTDAYMAQHPDGDDPRQIQSVSSHLIALEAVLVQNQPRTKTAEVLVAAIDVGRDLGGYRTLRRPRKWSSTIRDVIEGRISALEYVESVLASWHGTELTQIEEWTEETLRRLYS